jgi:hypothetical protein
VHASFVRVDVVRECEHRFVIRGRPLHGDLNLVILRLRVEESHALVHRVPGRVHVLYEVDYAAGVPEILTVLRFHSVIDEPDLETTIKEGHLAQALRKRVELELTLVGEDLGIGPERYGGAGALDCFDAPQLPLRAASLVGLCPELSPTRDLDLQTLRERVYNTYADSVQPSGYLIALAAELSSSMQGREDNLDGRFALTLNRVDGNAPTVVGDTTGSVGQELNDDPVAVTRHRLVDRVVNNLVNEVMEPARPGRADIHAGTLPDRLKSLKDGDVLGGVGSAISSFGCRNSRSRCHSKSLSGYP